MRTFVVVAWVGLLPSLATTALAQGPPALFWKQSSPGPVKAIKFSPDGSLLATGGGGTEEVRLWNASNGALFRTFVQPSGGINSLSFSPDGELLAVGTSGPNQNLNVWHLPEGLLLFGRINAHANGTTGVAYSPDGELLATGGRDRTTKVWIAHTMNLVRTLNDGSPVQVLAYSPDGTIIASGTQNGIHLWRAGDGLLFRTINPGTNALFALAISPDSRLLAANSATGIGVWDILTGTLLRNLGTPDTGTATGLDFSSDGQMLLSGNDVLIHSNEVGVIRFWRAFDGALLRVFDHATGPAGVVVAYAPSGARFGYGRFDGGVAVALNPFLP